MKFKYQYSMLRSMSYIELLGSIILFLIITIPTVSCKKLVEVDVPITSLTSLNTYNNDGTATSVLTGIFGSMGSGEVYTGSSGISLRCGLSADELVLWNGGFNGGANQQLYQNNLSARLPIAPDYWQDYYKKLLTINSAIEGLEASNTLTKAVQKQLLGESLFLRAFFHFYLISFFGDIPLVLASDWRVNAIAARTPKEEVYQQIIEDLKHAYDLLNGKYVKSDALSTYDIGSEERVRPTKWAAAALLARIYLYAGDWGNAEIQATNLINHNSLFGLNTLDQAFEKNNKEAIWQIQYVNSDRNTEGFHFILTENPGFNRPTYLSNFLMNAFDAADERKSKWIGSYSNGTTTYYYPFKYKAQIDPNNSEYLMVLRLAEQYLIRAEARAQQNKINEAQGDLDVIRSRAGLLNTTANEKSSLLAAILHERQVELFTEWGHRWFDLKRTGTLNTVMSIVYPTKKMGGTWNSDWQLYPLPETQIVLNPNLAPNNPGY